MADREHKEALYAHVARAGKALAHGKRLELLDLLAQAERSVEALAVATGLSVTSTSAHLQVLRRGGLVQTRRDGNRVHYRLAGDDVARLLVSLRELAADRLADVERAAREYLGEDDVEPVSREELQRRLRQGDVVVVDVRPAEEYAAGHVRGAVSIPVDELERRIGELPPGAEVVAYCRGPLCVYAPQAVGILRRHGVPARRLEGGFPEWRLERRPVRRLAS